MYRRMGRPRRAAGRPDSPPDPLPARGV